MDREIQFEDIPLLPPPEKETQKSPKDAFFFILSFILCAIGGFILIATFTSALSRIGNDLTSRLFSALIPDFEISEPLLPPLPESEEIQEDTNGTPPTLSPIYIKTADLSTSAENGFSLTNETSYAPDLHELYGAPTSLLTLSEAEKVYGKGAPLVLLYHSHATESYSDTAREGFRTTDDERNVIAVGQVIAEVLERAGIGVIHLTEQFDRESWSSAYDNSNAQVRSALAENPSLQYVFDIHRDCIGNDSEGYVRAATEYLGHSVSQLMFVCGTDEGGSGHSKWRDNLSFGLSLQSSLHASYPSLMRPINLRRASFYQDTSPAALLLECGTCAGTLTEAKRAGVLFAIALAEYIKGEDCKLSEEALFSALCS